MTESLTNFKLYFCCFYILVITLTGSNAQTKCDVFQWKCKNGECISSEELCNGKVACRDSSDETEELCAGVICPPYATKCNYGACVNFNAKCNGILECADNSDEANCDPVEVAKNKKRGFCPIRNFPCREGECIPTVLVCDGKQDCSNGSDETLELCSLEVCPAFGFKCKYGACVHGKTRCNGLNDCADGSDESVELCGPPPTLGQTHQPPVNDVVTQRTPAPTPPPPFNDVVTQRTPAPTPTPPFNDVATQRTPAPTTEAPVYDEVTPPNLIHQISTPETDHRSCPALFDDPNIWAVHAYNTSVIVNYGEIIGEFREIIYRCMRTYVLYGSKDNLCLNGQWLYPIPKCSRVCPPEVINGVTFSTKCKLDHSETPCTGLILPNTRVDISCSTGYRTPFYDIPETIQCRETGEWDYRPASCVSVCGRLTINATPFITGGDPVNITKVPWHTAIYKSVGGGKFDHICGGTIYSAKLIISAAHCFWDVRRDMPEDNSLFRVAVGKVYRSYNAYEPLLTQFFNVSEIHIPLTYGGVSRSYENDIAILVLSNYIFYKDHIKPICIRWFTYGDREIKPGTVGRVAGWGKINGDNQFGEDLKAVDLPAFSKEQCLKDDSTFNNFITGEKFCVGAPNDESVCEGDSGGGYVVKNEDTGTYYLWGVLSVGLGRTCERDHLTTFTNIQYHKDMITDYEIRFRPK